MENAYILYLKFMTLFLEKIRKHPDFATVTAKEKAAIQLKLREVLPKAEKLREQLLRKYTEEYDIFLQEEVRSQTRLRCLRNVTFARFERAPFFLAAAQKEGSAKRQRAANTSAPGQQFATDCRGREADPRFEGARQDRNRRVSGFGRRRRGQN